MRYEPYVLCPVCFAKEGGEEKCCSHGCFDATCRGCGAKRNDGDPFWSCTGSTPVDTSPKGEP